MQIELAMRNNLIALAKAYCGHTGSTLGAVSRRAHGDPPFFERLKAGDGSISARKYEEVGQWFHENWPDDLARPALDPIPHLEAFPLKGAKNGTTKGQQKQVDQGKAGQGAENQGKGQVESGRRRRRQR